ncbi:MAG: hypothetical protein WBA89_10665 [Microcoleus sp.]|uniref:hypothetical protein n=1 Tax=Microcoleus sp. TaxID=44472 RepID=UPI003C7095ED
MFYPQADQLFETGYLKFRPIANSIATMVEFLYYRHLDPAQKRIQVSHKTRHPPQILD